MRDLLDDQMEEMHGLFVAHFQKNKRMPETPKWSHCDQTHRIHVWYGAAIYGNMDPINIPQSCQHIYTSTMDPMGELTELLPVSFPKVAAPFSIYEGHQPTTTYFGTFEL